MEGQARVVWANLLNILRDAGLGTRDIASITTYVVVSDDLEDRLAAVMGVRDEVMGSTGPRARS